ncbi:hypothetical protein PAMP_006708 [Pampus punctatissimus]
MKPHKRRQGNGKKGGKGRTKQVPRITCCKLQEFLFLCPVMAALLSRMELATRDLESELQRPAV